MMGSGRTGWQLYYSYRFSERCPYKTDTAHVKPWRTLP
jgi:hypothetical protein